MLHIAMYPWFAMGHLTPFLHLSNKLAERGHRITFFLPPKTLPKLEHFNLHPHLIDFVPITVPQVDGLPPGAETTADVSGPQEPLLVTAMDLTKPTIQAYLQHLKPHFVFYDFVHWLPALARPLGIRCIYYSVVSPATSSYFMSAISRLHHQQIMTAPTDLMEPPLGFPAASTIKLRPHEARALSPFVILEYGNGISFAERIRISSTHCDAVAFKACREMEGAYCDYVEAQGKRPVFLTGPVLTRPPPTWVLEERWATWLDGFQAKTVIFCALGSQCRLPKGQFRELLLGLELTGMPFLAALKPAVGEETVESGLPEGFERRIGKRGVVEGGWVQQQLILKHPSVGCFVTHCGSGSLSEAMVSDCQLVLLPQEVYLAIDARMMAGDLRVGVEVEKGDEDGLFNREGVCRAIRSVMEGDSEIGKEVMANHAKWKKLLLSEGFESSYIDAFIQKLQLLLQ